MAHTGSFSAAVPDLARVVVRRKRAARLTLAAHLAFVLVLGAVMVTTEGSSAPTDAGHAVTLARMQEVFLTVAVIAQLALSGWWTRLALAVRRIRQAGSRADASPEPQDYAGRMALWQSRETRGVVRGCMTAIVVLCWLPELGYLVQAQDQTGTGGYAQSDSGFTIGTLFFYAVFAGGVALVAGFAKLIDRAGTAARSKFAAANAQLTQAAAGLSADPAPVRRARAMALRWAIFCGFLALVIVVTSGWALATGHFSGRIAFMAPVLLLLNLARLSQCLRAVKALRRAEQAIGGRG
jgi:hypothetical protein